MCPSLCHSAYRKIAAQNHTLALLLQSASEKDKIVMELGPSNEANL